MIDPATSTLRRAACGLDPRREPELFAGLRVVLIASNCRAGVLATLASARWLSLRGAEVLLMDTGSEDGTPEAVERMGFVDVVRTGHFHGLLSDLACEPRADGALAPRWILQCEPGESLDRFQVQGMIAELEALPGGRLLVTEPAGGSSAGGGPRKGTVLARAGDLRRLGNASGGGAWFVKSGQASVGSAGA